MNMERKHHDHAYHGSEWPEHEDFLVGNREGLEKLMFAISEALEKGESNIDSGEFVGARCLETEFFESQPNHVSKWSIFVGWFIVIAVITVFIIGLVTVFSWVGRSC